MEYADLRKREGGDMTCYEAVKHLRNSGVEFSLIFVVLSLPIALKEVPLARSG
jgi:hypothetical protein